VDIPVHHMMIPIYPVSIQVHPLRNQDNHVRIREIQVGSSGIGRKKSNRPPPISPNIQMITMELLLLERTSMTDHFMPT
jgi:hypothetical protein